MIYEGDSAEWFMEFCNYKGNKYIFGTGTQAVNTLFLLELFGKSVDGVIVSVAKDSIFNGLPVYGEKDVSDKENSAVLLAVGEKVSQEVIGMIEENGFGDIFLCTDWESANDQVKEKVFINYLDEKGIDYCGDTIELDEYRFLNPLKHPRCYRQMLMGTAFSEIIIPAIMRDDRYGTVKIYDMIADGITKMNRVIDIGANAGAFSVYAARHCKKVLAIDASRTIFPYLNRNAELAGNIEVLEAAVSDFDGCVKFYDRKDYPKYSGTSENTLGSEYEETTRSIDSIVEEFGYKPDFIRVDIGRDAIKAISGAKEVMKKYHPNLLICDADGMFDELRINANLMDYRFDKVLDYAYFY